MTETAIVKSADETSWELVQRKAKAFAASELVPTQYQGNVPNVIIAMEIAAKINISPLAVMQNLYIVHGRPAFESKFLIACVNASGKFSPLRYRFEGEEGTDSWGCRAYAADRETGEECVGPLVTMETARKEGWTSKKGSKWETMPELMLRYRSAAWWSRVFAPEISLGFQTADEVRDVHAPPAQVVNSLDDLTDTLKGKADELAPDPDNPIPYTLTTPEIKTSENFMADVKREREPGEEG